MGKKKRNPVFSVKVLTFSGHPIADAHPGNLDAIIFPGQDYNNARVYDFSDVAKWDQNKRKSSNGLESLAVLND